MALYRLETKMVCRKRGESSIDVAAYQSGEKLLDTRDGQVYNFNSKTEVVHTGILLPDNAPPEFSDREKLWNAVEKAEDGSTRWKDAQTARKIIVALPRELSFPEQKELLIEYTTVTFVNQGMVADVAMHDKGDGNPHAHILLTTRTVSHVGFGLKDRNWNDRKQLHVWREEWSKAQNHVFMTKNLDVRVAYKSHKRRGNADYKPTKHLGPVLTAMERRGIKTRLGDYNRAIEAERAEQKCQQQIGYELNRGHDRERGR